MTDYPLTQDFNHVSEALALLTGQFSSDLATPDVRNLVRAMTQPVQDVENSLWDAINSQLIANTPTGQALNQLGDLIGEPRGGLNETQYLLWIQIAIRARKSGGRTEDLLAITALAVGTNQFTYTDWYPGDFDIYVPAMTTDAFAGPLDQALRIARPPGTYGNLDYWDTENYILPLWSCSDSVSSTGGQGLGDSVSGADMSVPISSLSI
jgi:hypothetical protein